MVNTFVLRILLDGQLFALNKDPTDPDPY